MQDALFWTATVGGAGLGLLTAAYLFREGLKTKPEGPSGYFWFAAWPLLCGGAAWFCGYILIGAAAFMAVGVLSQFVALGIGAAIGLALALRENQKRGWKGAEALRNVVILVPLCAAMTSFGWMILQGWAGCSGGGCVDPEDTWRRH